MIFEYASNGDLREYLRVRRPGEGHPSSLSPFELLNFSHQIAAGMKFLSYNRIVHRDLAMFAVNDLLIFLIFFSSRNILVDSTNTCRIADFGLFSHWWFISH